MDYGHWISHLADSIIVYLGPTQLFYLRGISKKLQIEFDSPTYWKSRLQQFYPKVYPHGSVHLSDFQFFRVLTLPHKYCDICSQPISDECLLQLCDCLGCKDYLRSHTDCLQPYLKHKRTPYVRVRTHICPFCGEVRMCLPIKNRMPEQLL